MSHANRSFREAFGKLNILSGVLLMAFLMFGVWASGLGGTIIEWLDTHPLLGIIATLLVLIMLFVSSNTRSPDDYHWAELALIFLGIGLMLVLQFVDPFAHFVEDFQPLTGTVILFVMGLSGLAVGK